MDSGAIDANMALLRAPPFPGTTASVALPEGIVLPPVFDAKEIERIFAALRDNRVGGAFWAPQAATKTATVLVRPRSASEIAPILAILNDTERANTLWLLPANKSHTLRKALQQRNLPISGDVDPWSLIDSEIRLIAHGDDEWVALAQITGRSVHILSAGRFGSPSANVGDLRRSVAESLLRHRYRDPYTETDTNIEATIAYLAHWRHIFEANSGIVAACGMAWWKRREIARFLWRPGQTLRFFRSERRAIAHAARSGGAVAVWPSYMTAEMTEMARLSGVPLIRIEDGFVRSIGLGSNLVPPSSITVDRLGIHYDPMRPSDLEMLLAEAEFLPPLVRRAQTLRGVIRSAGISKYGGDREHVFPPRELGRRLVLVPGQVEDDMSVLAGGNGLTSNLELLRRTRVLEPEAEIWFRPHPDVDAGHRKGTIRDEDALELADRVVRGGAMARLLDMVDAVHVLTSLTGFEALMRGLDVTCHGTPFYAGWGLTRDLAPVPSRRNRALTIDELVAGVLILYPRYLDPVTGLPCPPEILIQRMTEGGNHNRLGWITRVRKWQGWLMKRFA